MSDPRNDKRDLVLAPTEYAYMQDVTKGIIKTYAGPTVINPTAQERPIRFDPKTGKFEPCSLEQAVQQIAIAPEGYYLVLKNPVSAASKNDHPHAGGVHPSPDLDVGRKINVTGPCSFALWPGQMVKLVQGHHLRSNQYLVVRIYNEEEARQNWSKAVIKPVDGSDAAAPTLTIPKDLTVGKLLIIKGTDVSFYIPPTGVGVVPESQPIGDGQANIYVRDALTLERLEYCILVDQNGKKRFEQGPQVVFPEPSERFYETKERMGVDGAERDGVFRKFRAIELNEIQGIQVKVIAPYEERGVKHAAGDELFITGKETAIYYPREEHAIIRYDGKDKHFATAIPKGEARYMMDRRSGEIRMIRGSAMLLPNPIHEVIVRRVLSPRQCEDWYPGNLEVSTYNSEMRALLARVPTTRAGAISEGEVERSSKNRGVTRGMATLGGEEHTRGLIASAAPAMMNSSHVGKEQRSAGDEISRQSTYNGPRTITLDTKFQGAPAINVFTGYAVMVASNADQRRVEIGPKNILLEYDETLIPLVLSTGKPKCTDHMLRTVYLRITNNKISDVVTVETEDHVSIDLRFSHCVDFEGDPNKWFAVENYVKLLCDHVRSILKGAIRKIPVQQFYRSATDIIRDTLLGKREEKDKDGKRPGMPFAQNGMRLVDVEVLGVEIKDAKIRQLLEASQQSTVQSAIELANMSRQLEVVKAKLHVQTEEKRASTAANLVGEELKRDALNANIVTALLECANKLKQLEADKKVDDEEHLLEMAKTQAALGRKQVQLDQGFEEDKRRYALREAELVAQTQATIARFGSLQGGFTEAMLMLQREDVMARIAEAWSVQGILGGENVVDVLKRIFSGTPIEALTTKLLKAPANGASMGSSSSASVS